MILRATNDAQEAYRDADYIVIATPTNYDDQQDHFDTSAVESVIEEALAYNRHGSIVIKSTIPVGYVKKVRAKRRSKDFCGTVERKHLCQGCAGALNSAYRSRSN